MKLKDCEILLTEPRGFCAGVERAIGIVNRAIEMFDEEIYVKHEVVHNKNVIEELTKKGVVFIESLTEIPDKSILIYSAHGVSKEVTDIAQKKNLRIFDATCPLVTKVHFEIHKYARENIDVILIGHNGHPEVEGTMGQYTSKAGKIYLVESKDDVETLEIINTKISYVTQTTLSVDDTQDIVDALKEKYPHIQGPKKSDICYATQNRQEAVKKILDLCDSLVVVGSQNSSNSQRLKEIAVQCGKDAYLIDHESQLDIDKLSKSKVIGITAGASAPEHTVQALIKFLINNGAKMSNEEIAFKEEAVAFSLPKSLRY
jgi:4-hydroxy-3-methylbut-2-enyl diphosphate reductase|tara:strand:- start:100 stop:1047 length:948 start_codon:yes stop_codon:yes gene_type:complete